MGLGKTTRKPRYRRAKSELFRTSIAAIKDAGLSDVATTTFETNYDDSRVVAMTVVEEW